jgi:hypothetical protein
MSWNLDQALLWVATRNEALVAEAASPHPKTTWMEAAAGWTISHEPRPVDTRGVEAMLLRAMQDGQITLCDDLTPVETKWLDGAEFLNKTERGGSRPLMKLVRTSKRSLTPLEAALSGLADEIAASPRLNPDELRAVFPTWHVLRLFCALCENAAEATDLGVVGGADTAATVSSLKSGLPGRPNSKHLYRAEAARRIAVGACPDTLSQFARELSEWLQREHSDEPPGGPSAIENAIRDLWHDRHKASPKTGP